MLYLWSSSLRSHFVRELLYREIFYLHAHGVAPPFSVIPATGLQLLSITPHAVSKRQMFPPSFPIGRG